MNARDDAAWDDRLAALHELNKAQSGLNVSYAGLRLIQQQLAGIGSQVSAIDQAVDALPAVQEAVHRARYVLWSGFTDGQKAKCA